MLLHALRAPPLYADASSITIINSTNYPKNFLKFRSHVFVLMASKIHAKSATEL